MEKYLLDIRNLGIITDNVWNRRLDDAKRPIVEAVRRLISTDLKFISSSGSCNPCSKKLLEALLPDFPDIEQAPFTSRPHTFLYQRKHGLIVDPTYLQHFDVGQYHTMPYHYQTEKRAEPNRARIEEIFRNVGAVLVATKEEVKRLFVANKGKIAINGILRDWHRTEEESEFLAGYRYNVPQVKS